jgi:hypothetical protein
MAYRVFVSQEMQSLRGEAPPDARYWATLFPESEEPPPIAVSLDAARPSSRDHVWVTVRVTNIGDVPFAWDREFAAPLQWHLWSNRSNRLTPKTNRDAERPMLIPPEERFVVLKPGESLQKEFELTKPVRVWFTIGGMRPMPGGGLGHTSDPIEQFEHYEVPAESSTVSVGIDYDSIGFGASGFRNSFGATSRELGLPRARVQSNLLRIPITN